jgi:hypothetical protein
VDDIHAVKILGLSAKPSVSPLVQFLDSDYLISQRRKPPLHLLQSITLLQVLAEPVVVAGFDDIGRALEFVESTERCL